MFKHTNPPSTNIPDSMQSDIKSYLSLFKGEVFVGRHWGADSGKCWRLTIIYYFIFWPLKCLVVRINACQMNFRFCYSVLCFIKNVRFRKKNTGYRKNVWKSVCLKKNNNVLSMCHKVKLMKSFYYVTKLVFTRIIILIAYFLNYIRHIFHL